MWSSILKTVAATAVFAAVHSALASRRAKRAAAAIVGDTTANGTYRALYVGQSLVTAGMLWAYIRRQPSVELYHLKGPGAAALRAGQAIGLVYAMAGAYQVGILRIAGVENWLAWVKGQPVPPMPEAQGPMFDDRSRARPAGPFAWSRHPLNFSPIPVLWLSPRMTSNLMAFNLAATVYLALGSLHEEARLLASDGDAYRRYQLSGVSFYLPVAGRSALESVDQLLPPTSDHSALRSQLAADLSARRQDGQKAY